jgi:hypothetical protein
VLFVLAARRRNPAIWEIRVKGSCCALGMMEAEFLENVAVSAIPD